MLQVGATGMQMMKMMINESVKIDVVIEVTFACLSIHQDDRSQVSSVLKKGGSRI
jgi:hypothetical protein